jgi:hypothetical protein
MSDTKLPSSTHTDDRLQCRTAGNLINDLKISGHVHRCGHIEDGVAFEFGDQGSWVLAFDDLKRAYEAACKFRCLSIAPSETEDRKDAERYRWLRNRGCCQDGKEESCYLDLNARDLDAAIDSALEAPK